MFALVVFLFATFAAFAVGLGWLIGRHIGFYASRAGDLENDLHLRGGTRG